MQRNGVRYPLLRNSALAVWKGVHKERGSPFYLEDMGREVPTRGAAAERSPKPETNQGLPPSPKLKSRKLAALGEAGTVEKVTSASQASHPPGWPSNKGLQAAGDPWRSLLPKRGPLNVRSVPFPTCEPGRPQGFSWRWLVEGRDGSQLNPRAETRTTHQLQFLSQAPSGGKGFCRRSTREVVVPCATKQMEQPKARSATSLRGFLSGAPLQLSLDLEDFFFCLLFHLQPICILFSKLNLGPRVSGRKIS